MKIALDYDLTYTKDPEFWRAFVFLSKLSGHEVRIVTARCAEKDTLPELPCEIIYCNGVAKKFVCHHFVEWDPDIWIDDKPESILNNSPATKEILADWRSTRDH